MNPTFLYLIEAENGLVKIGSGQYPTDRAASCRTHSPIPTRLIAVWPGTCTDEFELHRRFAEYRLHGEWFRPHGELFSFVEHKFGKGLNRIDTWLEAKALAELKASERDQRRSRSEARKLICQPERERYRQGKRVGLTKVQSNGLAFIRSYIADKGISPSFDDIRIGLGLASKSGVHRVVNALKERGHINFLSNRARSIALAEPVTEAERGQVLAHAA